MYLKNKGMKSNMHYIKKLNAGEGSTAACLSLHSSMMKSDLDEIAIIK